MRTSPTSSFLFCLALISALGLAAVGCGGGGHTHDGVPVAGGGAKCKTKLDPDKILCYYGTISSGGSVIVGDPGATDPGAKITVTGKNDNTEVTANDDGSFGAGYNGGNGETVTVTAEAPGCEPTSVQVTICR